MGKGRPGVGKVKSNEKDIHTLPTPQHISYPLDISQSCPNCCTSKSCVSNAACATLGFSPSYTTSKSSQSKSFISQISHFSHLSGLEEKSMMVRKLHPPINMEKTGHRLLALIHHIARREAQVSRVPVIHFLIRPGWIRHAVMAPAMHGRRTWLEALELATPWFLSGEFIVGGRRGENASRKLGAGGFALVVD